MIVCQAKNADFLDGEGSDSDVGWLNEWLCQPYICINHILHHWAFRWYKFCDVHKLFSTHHTLQSELLRPFTTKMKLSSSSTDLSDPKHFFEILISNLNFFFSFWIYPVSVLMNKFYRCLWLRISKVAFCMSMTLNLCFMLKKSS